MSMFSWFVFCLRFTTTTYMHIPRGETDARAPQRTDLRRLPAPSFRAPGASGPPAGPRRPARGGFGG